MSPELQKLLNNTVTVLTATLRAKDPYTAEHQHRVAQIAVNIAQEMGADPWFVEGMRVMGLLHDLGKIAIPSAILSKPGTLSRQEFDLIKMHPQQGHDLLMPIKFPWRVALAVLQHHERLDGSGPGCSYEGDFRKTGGFVRSRGGRRLYQDVGGNTDLAREYFGLWGREIFSPWSCVGAPNG